MSELDQTDKHPISGGCLCGAIQYTVHGELRDVVNCHCSLCRKFHGHHGAYTAALIQNLEISDSKKQLGWYRSPGNHAQRGFCKCCGSSLFWVLDNDSQISITAGTLNQPTGLQTTTDIYVLDKADYYRLDSELKKFAQGL